MSRIDDIRARCEAGLIPYAEKSPQRLNRIIEYAAVSDKDTLWLLDRIAALEAELAAYRKAEAALRDAKEDEE